MIPRSKWARSKEAPGRNWVNWRVESMIGMEVKCLHVIANKSMAWLEWRELHSNLTLCVCEGKHT